MENTKDLSSGIRQQLPVELTGFMEAVGAIAAYQGYHLYLVGGAVRDLLLERSTFDVDLVVEGDAVALAQQAANVTLRKLVVYPRFGTATLHLDKWNIDFARARSETYSRPGALPRVRPGSLTDDLFRRDFTINAMAVRLNPGCFGELIDIHGGIADLEQRLVRVLHKGSFIDDATRIWRALRYEQRLDFRLEEETLGLLKRDLPMLDTISGDRLRHELELVLREEKPEKALCRVDELNVLSRLHPLLRADRWISAMFERAREVTSSGLQLYKVYLALLTCRMTADGVEEFISEFRMSIRFLHILRDGQRIKTVLPVLDAPDLAPSRIYTMLYGYSLSALTAWMLVTESPVVSRNIKLYLTRLRHVRTCLAGDDLMKLGVVPGPAVGDTLESLHTAKLDGKATTRQGELELVQQWLRERS